MESRGAARGKIIVRSLWRLFAKERAVAEKVEQVNGEKRIWIAAPRKRSWWRTRRHTPRRSRAPLRICCARQLTGTALYDNTKPTKGPTESSTSLKEGENTGGATNRMPGAQRSEKGRSSPTEAGKRERATSVGSRRSKSIDASEEAFGWARGIRMRRFWRAERPATAPHSHFGQKRRIYSRTGELRESHAAEGTVSTSNCSMFASLNVFAIRQPNGGRSLELRRSGAGTSQKSTNEESKVRDDSRRKTTLLSGKVMPAGRTGRIKVI